MASSGPNSPSTIADDSSFGSVAWSNPSNAGASDDSDADARISSFTGDSHYLKATNFGFSIPAGATIDGILVEVEKASQGAGADHRDARARIVKGGTIGSTDKADTATTWGTTDAYSSYGGASDLWGETWGASDINSSTFGFAFATQNLGGSARRTYVDHIRVTVYYTAAAGGSKAQAMMMGV